MASKVLNIKVIVLGVLAFIMCAASCGGKYWIETKIESGTHSGLWRMCVQIHDVTDCKTLEKYFDLINEARGTDLKVPDYLTTVRAFTILACLVLPAGLLFAVLSLLTEKAKVWIAATLYLVGALCMLIAMSVFTDKEEFDTELLEYGWSYILGWVGMVLARVGAINGFVAGATEKAAVPYIHDVNL